jgi:2-oxoacid:acceptor oxidoreductase gamma subunit (pyruvate/2-ketoisovalerate family)
MNKNKKYIEIVWHGRGGQGAITAGQLIAESAYNEGYLGVTTAPMFGAERRGAPVKAFLRLAKEPIKIFSQIYDPDIIVVLDPTLLPMIDIHSNARKDIIIIVNSSKNIDEINEIELQDFHKVGIADITRIALNNNLTIAGSAILNTPILGAFAKTTELVSMESIENSILNKFGEKHGASNIKAAKETFDATTVHVRD